MSLMDYTQSEANTKSPLLLSDHTNALTPRHASMLSPTVRQAGVCAEVPQETTGRRVHPGARLVKQHDFWITDQGNRHRKLPLRAARESRCSSTGVLRDSHSPHILGGSLLHLCSRVAL